MKQLLTTCLVLIGFISSALAQGINDQALSFRDAQSFGILDQNGRILGGVEAEPHEFPWIARIEIGNVFCAGSLIEKNWVLTAAHCVTCNDRGQEITVTLPEAAPIKLNRSTQHTAAIRYQKR